MRPILRFLEDDLIVKIIDEAKEVLCTLGVEIQNKSVLNLLSDFGAAVQNNGAKVKFTNNIIEKALSSVNHSFKLFDVLGENTHDFKDHNVYFTPGSAALKILDFEQQKMRKPVTQDYIHYTKIVSQLKNIQSQSTAMIPSDVHDSISDSYRLFLSLLYCEKPVVTGTFTIESFEVMKNMLVTVRGSEENLRKKPLSVFSCCPTSPLKWSDITSQNVLDCAHYGIPIEFISMPLSGFVAPVTLTGTLIQHTAETLSGIVFSQLANPGTPILYGGSPAVFDVRYETTPMGAVETMMIDCAYNEIGKYLGIPTQAYIALSDSKYLDAQAGFETSMGATLAALSGINNVSGPGMLDFESCLSLEKLILDNEICGMSQRMLRGITPKEDFPSIELFRELLNEEHLLISKHTRKYLREEHYFCGPVINRANKARWEEEGSTTLGDRAKNEVNKLIEDYIPSRLADETKNELINLMLREGAKFNQENLPGRE